MLESIARLSSTFMSHTFIL